MEVKSIAREAGSRTKMAVWSNDENVDPIGACVGPKGQRVGSIVEELRGEKIDIVKYSEDPAQFIAAALAPADVVDVWMDAALLQQLQDALQHPAFPLYLGRRSCPPALPLCLGLRQGSLQEVLQTEPPLCPGKLCRMVLDADPQEPGAAVQRDVPVSFDPHHRQYGYRSARELWLTMSDGPESTGHDPFREL